MRTHRYPAPPTDHPPPATPQPGLSLAVTDAHSLCPRCAQSEEHNRPYYYNNVTNEVVWEKPADSNVAWIMYHEVRRLLYICTHCFVLDLARACAISVSVCLCDDCASCSCSATVCVMTVIR